MKSISRYFGSGQRSSGTDSSIASEASRTATIAVATVEVNAEAFFCRSSIALAFSMAAASLSRLSASWPVCLKSFSAWECGRVPEEKS